MMELYLNQIDLTGTGRTTAGFRAGTALVWGNDVISDSSAMNINTECYRQTQVLPYGPSDGAAPIDKNDTEGNGTYVPGHSPRQFASGSISSSTFSGTTVAQVVVNGINGTLDWTGYELSDLTNPAGTVGLVDDDGAAVNCLITASSGTSNQATFTVSNTANQNYDSSSSWKKNDTVVIYRVLRSMDQPGMGQTDLLTGNPATGVSQWPHQNVEPIYAWLNTFNGANQYDTVKLPLQRPYPTIKENRDFFNWNASFVAGRDDTLSTGVGVGTLAQRPTHCTPGVDGVQPQAGTGNAPGVAYWATDTNTLYACTDTNTWTSYYTPYIYPHPLVSGDPVPPEAPQNLRIK
jgi:hypothetical protein